MKCACLSPKERKGRERERERANTAEHYDKNKMVAKNCCENRCSSLFRWRKSKHSLDSNLPLLLSFLSFFLPLRTLGAFSWWPLISRFLTQCTQPLTCWHAQLCSTKSNTRDGLNSWTRRGNDITFQKVSGHNTALRTDIPSSISRNACGFLYRSGFRKPRGGLFCASLMSFNNEKIPAVTGAAQEVPLAGSIEPVSFEMCT